MSEPAFTPGPWLVTKEYDHQDDVIFAVEVEGGQRVCDLMTDFPEDAANARLIAAAPDMLAALEGLLAHEDMEESCYSPGYWQILQSARNAISKAKGEA